MVRQLSDGGGLARAVHADHHDHVRLGLGRPDRRLRHQIARGLGHPFQQLLGIDLLALGLRADIVHDMRGHFHADVRGQQFFLDFLDHLVGELALAEGALDLFDHALAGLGQALGDTTEKSHYDFLFSIEYK